jgi:hypothetical protein
MTDATQPRLPAPMLWLVILPHNWAYADIGPEVDSCTLGAFSDDVVGLLGRAVNQWRPALVHDPRSLSGGVRAEAGVSVG